MPSTDDGRALYRMRHPDFPDDEPTPDDQRQAASGTGRGELLYRANRGDRRATGALRPSTDGATTPPEAA